MELPFQVHAGVVELVNVDNLYIETLLIDFYSQSFQMTEYFSPEQAMSVRLSVCLCVCVCLRVCLSLPLFENYSTDFFIELVKNYQIKNLR